MGKLKDNLLTAEKATNVYGNLKTDLDAALSKNTINNEQYNDLLGKLDKSYEEGTVSKGKRAMGKDFAEKAKVFGLYNHVTTRINSPDLTPEQKQLFERQRNYAYRDGTLKSQYSKIEKQIGKVEKSNRIYKDLAAKAA